MVLVFDLDDTLYDELTYVHSGFKAVAAFLGSRYQFDSNEIYIKLSLIESAHGRGRVFNLLLEELNIFSKGLVGQCISVYRLHRPDIFLNPDAVRCLDRFSQLPLYIVTDGNKVVQRNKIRALGLQAMVKKVFITHQHGKKFAKPSPFCFQRIASIERAEPGEIFYIADNPKKDFIGIKLLGFKTIRIRQGMFRNFEGKKEQTAGLEINSLDEIDEKLLNKMMKNERDHN